MITDCCIEEFNLHYYGRILLLSLSVPRAVFEVRYGIVCGVGGIALRRLSESRKSKSPAPLSSSLPYKSYRCLTLTNTFHDKAIQRYFCFISPPSPPSTWPSTQSRRTRLSIRLLSIDRRGQSMVLLRYSHETRLEERNASSVTDLPEKGRGPPRN